MTIKVSYLIKIIFFSVSLLFAQKDRLIVIQGFILNVYFDGQYKEVTRGESLYGYGWVSNSILFIALQPENSGEAVAEIYLYNAKSGSLKNVTHIGGAGESHFDVNEITKKVVFNDWEGIKILEFDTLDFSYKIDLILDETDGFGVFWIDPDTIGFEDYNYSGGKKFVKMEAIKTPYYKSFRYQDLESKTKKDLRLLRNEIYARHNQSFKSEDLKWHFIHKNWYQEKAGHEVSETELNPDEKNLLKKIKDLEKE